MYSYKILRTTLEMRISTKRRNFENKRYNYRTFFLTENDAEFFENPVAQREILVFYFGSNHHPSTIGPNNTRSERHWAMYH